MANKISTSVWCTFDFVGFHYWKAAPDQVDFLRPPHRHIFKVKAGVRTTKSREVEFIQLKDKLVAYVREAYEGKVFTYSCEEIAADLILTFGLSYCEVSEDGENGASCKSIEEPI